MGGLPVPWPPGSGPVLFLLDAATKVERAHLEHWIHSSGGAPDRSVHLLGVDIERSIVADGLATPLEGDRSLVVVPLRLVWVPEKGPEASGPRLRDLVVGDPRHPRPALARLTLRRHPERARTIAGAPATLADLRGRHEAQTTGVQSEDEPFASFVMRMAGIALDVAERQLQGQRYKVPRFVVAGVESGPGFSSAVSALAERTGTAATNVAAEVHDSLSEMVATPSTFFIDWGGNITRWIVSLAYREVVVDRANVERARHAVRDHPSALLWSHKSHIDNIALMSVFYDNDFPAPHSMGGINMAFGGVGFLGRRAGVIFMRRSFQDQPAYKLALQRYLGFLLEKRFPLSWSFEGTRSRNGKLMAPRYGLLKYVVDGAHATGTRDLHLIPVTISYDLIGEAGEYATQEAGAPKQAESLGWFIGYLRRLRSPMGRIYVDFAEPVVIEGEAPPAEAAELSQLAFEVARRVNDQVPVTLPSLMCMALLGAAPRALTVAELDARLRSLIGWLSAREVRMAGSFDDRDAEQQEQLAELLFTRGLIDRFTKGPDAVFTIADSQIPVAGYYRNTIVHYFLNKAMAELALLRVAEIRAPEREEAFWVEVRWLRDALKFEFFHTPSDQFAAEIDREIARYQPAWPAALGAEDASLVTLLASMTPVVAHSILQPFLDAYWVVAELFSRLAPTETLDEKTCVNQALALGEQFLRQQRINSRASIGKQMFKGAYSLLADKGLITPGGDDVARGRSELAARFRELLDALAEIRRLPLLDRPTASVGAGENDDQRRGAVAGAAAP